MKIVITGHTGFIGRHLTERLLDHEIIGVSRSTANGKLARSIQLDICNMTQNKMEPYREDLEGADALIHLAAYRPIVRTGREDSLVENFSVNVKGALNVLAMSRRFDIGRIILASSKAVYGDRKSLFIESDVAKPVSNYGRSKLLAENVCETFAECYGMHCTALRLASVFGLGMPNTLVLANFLAKALKSEVITVHKHLTGYEKMDLIYVDDVLNAFEKALSWKASTFEVFNVGSKSPIDTFDLAAKVIEAAESHSTIKIVETNQTRRGVRLSIEKASAILGWKPKFTIESGIVEFLSKMELEARPGYRELKENRSKQDLASHDVENAVSLSTKSASTS
ncbi:NAD(P)-dependent oxidoreductase [Candidatus Bathyarchaeota archaeon]|nr:NAD(P)-dependent oxidoreductase [Candidatus Bathyarchaeota archaeon]